MSKNAGNHREKSPRVRAYVRWVLRHGAKLWAIALVIAVPAVVRMVGLYVHLKSDLDALLPVNAPSVLALDEFRQRMPVSRYLGIVVDVGSPENLHAGEAFLDALAARIRDYPKDLVSGVRTGVFAEQEFFRKHGALYVDLVDLTELRRRIEARRDAEVTRSLGLNLDDDERPPPVEISDLQEKYEKRFGAVNRFPDGRFSNAEQKTTLMLVEVSGFATGTDVGGKVFARVAKDIESIGGTEHFAPNMRIGFAGDVAITVEELDALVGDLTISSFLVVFLVLSAIYAFYRWWPSIPVLLLPLGLSTAYTFAIVTLPPFRLTSLNSNTAFLGSVIVGNGVNFGIILLARYREERERGASIEDAWTTAIASTRTGTIVAAAAAAIAYGSLIFTQFRGFRQFGTIGGIGMFMSWGIAFLLAPSLAARLDRNAPRPRATAASPFFMEGLVVRVTRHGRALLVVAAAFTALSVAHVLRFNRSYVESDFLRVRRRDSEQIGEGYWGRRMDALLGRYLTPLIILTNSADETATMAQTLQKRAQEPPLSAYVTSVQTIDDWVPTDQLAKIDETRAIRADLTPRVLGSLGPEQRRLVDQFFAGFAFETITKDDLPSSLTMGMREQGGRMDRSVFVNLRPSRDLWKGQPIEQLTLGLRGAANDVGRELGLPAPKVAGSIPLSYDIITSIERDGPVTTLIALSGVVLLVTVIFRWTSATALIIGSLLMAVMWLAATVMSIGIKINFSNLVAFPITFGIGVDYAVNMMARYRQETAATLERAMAQTARAVAMASLTTIIGYGSLLLAKNRGLFSFGVVAVLGEVACLSSALVVLPALISARLRVLRSRGNPDPEQRPSRYRRSSPADR
ncbi:MAG TPA: MMPL family transporter [Polyangiaceae bacterium]|nr:MMPL family transporter [Polyangiaceae bacterium]